MGRCLADFINKARRNNSYIEYLEIFSFESSTNLLTISCKVCGGVFKSDAWHFTGRPTRCPHCSCCYKTPKLANGCVDWEQIFSYKDGKLFWSHKRFSVNHKEGYLAEVISKNGSCGGYSRVCFNGKRYRTHIIIWEMFNKRPVPKGMQIDHLDHNRSNNRIENLRLVTHKENGRNISKKKNNTSGITGVGWNKKRQKWVAQICVDNKNITLGLYNTLLDAVAERKRAEKFYGFNENHGK